MELVFGILWKVEREKHRGEASEMGTGCSCSGKGPVPAVLSLGSCKVITAHAVPETNPFLGSSLLQRSAPGAVSCCKTQRPSALVCLLAKLSAA